MPGDINKITAEDVAVFKSTLDPIGHSGIGNALDCYQKMATKTAIYPGHGTPLGLMYVALKGAGEAGEFREHVGKAMRDDGLGNGLYYDGGVVHEPGTPLTDERRTLLIKEIGDELWYLSAKCNELGIKLSEAALLNLQKLQDRSDRGKLQGSGDDR